MNFHEVFVLYTVETAVGTNTIVEIVLQEKTPSIAYEESKIFPLQQNIASDSR